MVVPSSVPKVTFNNGNTAPVIGLGTWQAPSDGSVFRAVKGAIENGYRHIDCAQVYGNQAEIGNAIAGVIESGVVKREELFIVSKVWLTYYRKDRVPLSVKQTLSDLQIKYIDLMLLHWPFAFKQTDDTLFPTDASGKVEGDESIDYIEAYQALEKLVDQGLVKNIGISNFSSEQVERLLKAARIVPVVNQVECHPYLSQEKLRQFCEARGIKLTAYSPLGNPGSSVNAAADKDKLLKDSLVNELATKYGKNSGQVLIRYQTQRGVLVIPKSVHLERIISNLEVFDFELTQEEVDKLTALDRGYRSCAFEMTKHLKGYSFNAEF